MVDQATWTHSFMFRSTFALEHLPLGADKHDFEMLIVVGQKS